MLNMSGNDDIGEQQEYELLLKLHDLGLEKDNVYQLLFQYPNSY